MRRSTSTIFAVAIAAAFTVAASAGAADLVKYKIVKNDSITKSLTGKPGNPDEGKKVFINRRQGNCLTCHVVTALKKEPFHGNIGPTLDGVAERMNEGQMRLQVVNSKVKNPDTIMPAFYKADGFVGVKKEFEGKTVLTAEQVEDVVAYLKTLK